ncbi:DUF1611 domain-containing protein [Natronobacterium gregoryi]|uniref:DUF1611 domain-containing protein n=2 Tax=Natronobacterium gregoryi TaxID=44930 RepID=L0AEX6_NATGS|nr:DUF1611 domain-containing protein [Natronobacterium gregoryi]AFZ71989.1 hypothetical protein Natgr_0747 [Natronobacterium gregoryi SP2]ELY62648.1 hypothetical protein C490_17534 [Natronobacterium gregoryi SP2]PLK20843.1 DUF1611 domain-containing protein [Natronobacterium gregoryi SP2]SFJ19573.1 Uncharacterized conserved protein, NAD-dependent epimerase/dehydratase family [Natronobacterium gregoryi]
MRVAILAHEKFPERAKTALGVLRYADYDVAAVLDRDSAGSRVSDYVPDVQDAPIVGGTDDLEEDAVDALLIGIAPIGGDFDERWRPDVRTALEYGCDIISGLHYFLENDEEFAELAEENGCELRDIRKPPADLTVAEGIAGDVDAEVITTVGTDCSVGKMTATMELARDARAAGYDVGVVPTGQTGIMIEGWGIPIDRVVGDFTAGAVEEMIVELGDEHDYLLVEGQGSLVHPAYSAVTCGILHGSMPDKLVLCHDAGRETIHGYESFDLPSIPTYVDLYETLSAPVAETEVVAGTLNTADLEDDAAREAVDEYADVLGVPATDVIRHDTDEMLEAIL